MAPATSAPPPLPPTVEEAYRRKCIQLKQRTNEVEESNDAARLRLARLKRQVEKMRLERAFLLEQLAKRTSANVEDSDGSPSPPPTPKEKPLRIKRGHRKPSAFAGADASPTAAPGSTFISQNLLLHSPSSDAFSAPPDGAKTNGVHKAAPQKPGSAFDLYCDETLPSLKEASEDDGRDPVHEDEAELAHRWKGLSESQRDDYQTRADGQMAAYRKAKDAYDDAAAKRAEDAAATADRAANADATGSEPPPATGAGRDSRTPRPREDVEMMNYDTDQETQGDKAED